MLLPCKRLLVMCAAICAFSLIARADNLIANGGFETGNLAGWGQADPGGTGLGTVSATNATITPDGNPTVGPASGTYYALFSEENGPDANDIYQSFTVQANTSYYLSFDMFVNDVFGTGNFGGAAYICDAGCTELYGADTSQVDPGVPNPWVAENFNITSDLTAGDTAYVVFYAGGSNGPLDVGVDNVVLSTPEPSGLLTIPMLLITGRQWYKMRRTRRS